MIDRATAWHIVSVINSQIKSVEGKPLSIDLRDKRIFAAVPALSLQKYLSEHGWKLNEVRNNGSDEHSPMKIGVWEYEKKDDDGEEITMPVPHWNGFSDYASCVKHVIDSASQLENRGFWDVLEDVLRITA